MNELGFIEKYFYLGIDFWPLLGRFCPIGLQIFMGTIDW